MRAPARNWKFSRVAIEKETPSRRDGISNRKEGSIRKQCVALCLDIGEHLKMASYTIATATVYWQRFFMYQSHSKNDAFLIATACMLLAGKVEENFKSLQKITEVAYFFRSKKDPKALEAIRSSGKLLAYEMDKVTKAEEVLLVTLDFDFPVSHPYRPLQSVVRELGLVGPGSQVPRRDSIVQISWNFVNDSLRTTLCLQPVKPQDIAVSCVYLAATTLKRKLPDFKEGVPWFARFGTSIETIQEVERQIMTLYKRKDGSDSKTTSAVSVPPTPLPTPPSSAALSPGLDTVTAAPTATSPSTPAPLPPHGSIAPMPQDSSKCGATFPPTAGSPSGPSKKPAVPAGDQQGALSNPGNEAPAPAEVVDVAMEEAGVETQEGKHGDIGDSMGAPSSNPELGHGESGNSASPAKLEHKVKLVEPPPSAPPHSQPADDASKLSPGIACTLTVAVMPPPSPRSASPALAAGVPRHSHTQGANELRADVRSPAPQQGSAPPGPRLPLPLELISS